MMKKEHSKVRDKCCSDLIKIELIPVPKSRVTFGKCT